mgnify:CR=1 FL=1
MFFSYSALDDFVDSTLPHSPFCLLSSNLLSSCSPSSLVSYLSENKSERIIWINQSTIFALLPLFLPLQIEFSRSSQNYSLDTLQSMLLLYNLHICLFFRVISVCGLPFSRYRLLISILQMFDRSCQPMLNESITTIYRECESAIRDHVNSLAYGLSLGKLFYSTETGSKMDECQP